MNISEIAKVLDAKVKTGSKYLNKEIEFAFASDLMSDVLTLEKDHLLLITGLANTQSVRTAEMSDISAIVIARNKKVSADMIKIAEENKIILLECKYSMFHVAGLLFAQGVRPVY